MLIFFFGCKKDDNDGNKVEVPNPKLVTSSIPDGTENAPIGEQTIILTFDQNIVLVNSTNIQLNNQPVQQTSAAFKELQIKVNLQRATQYTLTIPANQIKGPTGVFSDEIRLSFKTRGSTDQNITRTLVTPNPTPEAQKVYDFLLNIYGKKILSGTMSNVAWNINEAEWVYKHTGRYPALACFDYIHLYASPANWINYEDTQIIENWWNKNGLISASWHWNVPTQEGSTNYQFYTADTRFDISKAIINGTYENNIVKADIDRMADHLLLLKNKNIPLLWRPLHEASGKWFWWGAKSAEDYRNLWIMMFETFQEKGVNNLIWVWTSQANDEAWYPGDEYVDMIGCDLYNKNNADEIADIYESLKHSFPNKMLSLSEFGNVANLTAQWDKGATWSWMMPWYDYERTNNPESISFDGISHEHADVPYWTRVFTNDWVISRDQMPNLK